MMKLMLHGRMKKICQTNIPLLIIKAILHIQIYIEKIKDRILLKINIKENDKVIVRKIEFTE